MKNNTILFNLISNHISYYYFYVCIVVYNFTTQTKIKICRSYDYKGKKLTDFPASVEVLRECKPVYEEVKGWKQELKKVRKAKDLPAAALAYAKKIEKALGVPIVTISIGPSREEHIIIRRGYIT